MYKLGQNALLFSFRRADYIDGKKSSGGYLIGPRLAMRAATAPLLGNEPSKQEMNGKGRSGQYGPV